MWMVPLPDRRDGFMVSERVDINPHKPTRRPYAARDPRHRRMFSSLWSVFFGLVALLNLGGVAGDNFCGSTNYCGKGKRLVLRKHNMRHLSSMPGWLLLPEHRRGVR